MNIFAVDKDPVLAAQALSDRHVSKMILESAQMLSFVAVRHGFPALYKTSGSHKSHPATIWAGNRYANWKWLVDHALALEEEKYFRTGRGHISADVIRYYVQHGYHPPEDGLEKQLFVLCMPDKYRLPQRVRAYRNFYVGEKQIFKDGRRAVWTKREPPSWWVWRNNG